MGQDNKVKQDTHTPPASPAPSFPDLTEARIGKMLAEFAEQLNGFKKQVNVLTEQIKVVNAKTAHMPISVPLILDPVENHNIDRVAGM
jgi:hypothetical protein